MGLLKEILGTESPVERLERLWKYTVEMLDDNEIDADVDKEEGVIKIAQGSALILIRFIQDDDEDCFVVIYSPILYLPEDNILPFYRRLLELSHFSSTSLTVDDDVVFAQEVFDVDDIEDEALVRAIARVALFADEIDNELSDEFNAVMIGPEEYGLEDDDEES